MARASHKTHKVVLVVGDTLFVHGGLLPEAARYGLAALNRDTSAWLRGQRASLPRVMEDASVSPVWTRALVDQGTIGECGTLQESLRCAAIAMPCPPPAFSARC